MNSPLRSREADGQSRSAGAQANTVVDIGQAYRVRRLAAARQRTTHKASGRRTLTRAALKRGRYTRARVSAGDYTDIAFDATLRAAALQQAFRPHNGLRVAIQDADMHTKVRMRKSANLIVFAVDASWSMAAAERMRATKGAILSLLLDAYQKRDKVCMLTFQHDKAALVLPPTSSVMTAQQVLSRIPVGGKTPLAAGMLLAYEVIRREKTFRADTLPLLVLLTDGDGNVSLTGLPPLEEALAIADLFAGDRVRSIVINTEHRALDKGYTRQITEHLHGVCYQLRELHAAALTDTIRRELAS